MYVVAIYTVLILAICGQIGTIRQNQYLIIQSIILDLIMYLLILSFIYLDFTKCKFNIRNNFKQMH